MKTDWSSVLSVAALVALFTYGPLALYIFLNVGCSAAQYELCRADARAKFHRDADQCETEECIDALTEREQTDLKECR